MLLQARRWHVLAAPLLLLDVVRVRQCLLGVHANVRHAVAGRQVALGYRGPARLRGQVSACRFLGRVDGITVVHAVIAGRGFGRVQACLSDRVSSSYRMHMTRS